MKSKHPSSIKKSTRNQTVNSFYQFDDEMPTMSLQFDQKIYKATLKDLCPEEKFKIGQLIKKLADEKEEKQKLLQELKHKTKHYKQKIKSISENSKILIQEQKETEEKFKQSIELLKAYQKFFLFQNKNESRQDREIQTVQPQNQLERNFERENQNYQQKLEDKENHIIYKQHNYIRVDKVVNSKQEIGIKDLNKTINSSEKPQKSQERYLLKKIDSSFENNDQLQQMVRTSQDRSKSQYENPGQKSEILKLKEEIDCITKDLKNLTKKVDESSAEKIKPKEQKFNDDRQNEPVRSIKIPSSHSQQQQTGRSIKQTDTQPSQQEDNKTQISFQEQFQEYQKKFRQQEQSQNVIQNNKMEQSSQDENYNNIQSDEKKIDLVNENKVQNKIASFQGSSSSEDEIDIAKKLLQLKKEQAEKKRFEQAETLNQNDLFKYSQQVDKKLSHILMTSQSNSLSFNISQNNNETITPQKFLHQSKQNNSSKTNSYLKSKGQSIIRDQNSAIQSQYRYDATSSLATPKPEQYYVEKESNQKEDDIDDLIQSLNSRIQGEQQSLFESKVSKRNMPNDKYYNKNDFYNDNLLDVISQIDDTDKKSIPHQNTNYKELETSSYQQIVQKYVNLAQQLENEQIQ